MGSKIQCPTIKRLPRKQPTATAGRSLLLAGAGPLFALAHKPLSPYSGTTESSKYSRNKGSSNCSSPRRGEEMMPASMRRLR